MPVGVAPPLDDAARERRSGFAAAIESDASMAIKSASAKESAVNLMAKYDRNRDGTFGVSEVVDIIEDLQEQTIATLKAQRQLKLYTILFTIVISCLALVVGVNAAVTWMTVDSAKDTETLRSLLTDRNGNVVAAKTAETTLPLIAAPVLDVATLASTDRLVITYALSATATVEKSVKVNDVTKYSDTWVEFELAANGASSGTVVIKDGAAVYTNTDDISYTICAADASCSAFTVDEETEVAALVAAAQLALGNSTSTGGRRRLDEADGDCTSTYVESQSGFVFTDETALVVSANEQLRTAVASYLNDPNTAIATYGEISTWDTSQVTDMSFLFAGATSFDEDISGWNTGAVTNMQEMFKGASAFNKNVNDWDVTRVYTMTVYMRCLLRPYKVDDAFRAPPGFQRMSLPVPGGELRAHARTRTRARHHAQPLR